MIPVYQCARFLPETLASVLCQDPGPDIMQIEVVDDASTDADIAALVHGIGGGRIGYFRQPENVGSLLNFHTCLQRSRGRYVHLLHGDDRVRPGFYAQIGRLFNDHPATGAAFCRYAYIDEEGRSVLYQDPENDHPGVLDGWLLRLCERQRVQYAAMVVRRDVYENLGGFYGVEYGEDWDMWIRIAARYPVAYTPEVLAEYRRHPSSISGKAFATGENMKSLSWVMQRAAEYLPPGQRDRVLARSQNFYAHYALRTASTLWTNFRDKRGATAQARAAWRMRRDIALIPKIIKLYTRIIFGL